MVTSVKVRAPSSTANLGPGFDVFGLALDAFHDEIILSKTNKSATNKPWHGIRILTTDDIPNIEKEFKMPKIETSFGNQRIGEIHEHGKKT